MTPETALSTLRDQAPLVQCITNYVAMNIAANVVLAAGASPAMVHATEEIPEFTPVAGALTINIGTLSETWLSAMKLAAQTAQGGNIPWVLDPVAHFISDYRRRAATDLVALQPAIIRGNASEILALAGVAGSGKGADSGDAVEAAEDAAKSLARTSGAAVAVTGPVDFLTDGARTARVAGGSALMPKVTALGCSLTALTGAYAAVTPPFEAARAALAHFAMAGAEAEKQASGPGSFQLHFLDALANVQPADLEKAVLI